MVCSPEQLAANRKNSKKSTGPSTPAGKSISRRNGLKHGLTGAGVVIADEDVEAVAERFEAFEADLKPANDVARFMVGRAALLSVRLDRSAREEAARITADMLGAEGVEEDARAIEFERLTERFADHPAESARKLRRSEEGIDWLLLAWRNARRDVLDREGRGWNIESLIRLSGLKRDSLGASRFQCLDQARAGNFNWLEPTDWPDLPPLERRAAAKAEILAIIDRAIAGLEEARENLDRERIAQIRAGATARAIFNPSPAATLARKYEATNERSFNRVLKQIEEINATAEEAVEPKAKPEKDETCEELASSLPVESVSRIQIKRKPESSRQNRKTVGCVEAPKSHHRS
jgi:hypothetical protein